jgi:DNA-binding SARP family transcriptional activator/WD40 repeat protein
VSRRCRGGITAVSGPLTGAVRGFETAYMGIDLLGPVLVGGANAALGHRDRVVLSALALEPGEVLSPERLADALWGETPPKSWPKVVQGSMMRLRRALGPGAIETTSGGYRLTVADDDVDTLRFERLVARGREFAAIHEPARAATAFELALGLWRGPAFSELEGWDVGRAAATRLTEVRRAIEEELVEARLGQGRPVEAVAEARRLTAREPYREHRWALLATALYRSGRQREALDVIRHAAQTLRDELGLDPGSELVALEQAVLRQDPALLTVPDRLPGSAEICPYKGLRPYGTQDAEGFFGREQAIAGCLSRLLDSPLLVLVGPSGSGKSSLLAAGVVPALRAERRRVVQLSPGAQPMVTLTAAMAGQPGPVVLVVDQLEELFTASTDDADIETFLARLVVHAKSGSPVLATLRADYLAGLAASPPFARLAERGLMLLTPMTETELEQAIEAPAAQAGLLLEPGLVDLLVRDVHGESGGLPLLSHALAETWERREGNVLTVEGYTQTGGIRAAVAQSAERLYDSLPGTDRAGLRTVMLRLVTPTATGDPVGARVPTRVFAGAEETLRLLDILVRARLVTADADTVSIAHESLTRAWPRLQSWLDEDVEGQRIFQHLQVAADGWEALGRPTEELYLGARLQGALEWRERNQPMLAPAEIGFLAAAEAHDRERRRREDRELRQQVRRNRQLRGALTGVVGLLVVALVAGTVATNRGRAARADAADAEAARLGTAALIQPQLDTTLLLARQAVALADTATTKGSLLEALAQQRGLIRIVQPDPSWADGADVGHAMLSPDGSRELINSSRGVELVDTGTGKAVRQNPLVAQPDNGDSPYPAGFIDGGHIAVVARQPTAPGNANGRELVAFVATNGDPVGSPQPVPGSVSGDLSTGDHLFVSPNDKILLSTLDANVRIWHRTATGWGEPTKLPLPHLPPSIFQILNFVTFSSDGARAGLLLGLYGPPFLAVPYVGIAVATNPARLLVPLITPEPGNNRPLSIDISPDGDSLAAGFDNGSVELRSLSGTGSVVRIPGESPVETLGWAAGSAQLVVGHEDGSLAVLDTKPLKQVASYPKTAQDDAALAALRDNRLITQSQSGSTTLRSLDGSDGLMQVLATSQRPNAIAVGPAGGMVAIGEINGDVAVYQQTNLPRPPLQLSLGPAPAPDTTGSATEHRRVTALAITPDGSALIASDRQGNLQMWSLPQGAPLWSRTDVPASSLAVSPNGKYLATAEFTQAPSDPAIDSDAVSTRVRVWDLATRQAVVTDNFVGQKDANGHTPKPRAVAFSPDSTLLAAAFFNAPVVAYSMARRARQASFGPDAAALAFSPDSKELDVQDFNGQITGFDPLNGRQQESFLSPATGYAQLLFTTDGQWLVGSDYTAISVWDAKTRRLVVSQLSLPSDGTSDALSLATTSDHELFVATQTGVIKLDLDPAHWNALACSVAGRSLTKAEWSRFLPDRSYQPACR